MKPAPAPELSSTRLQQGAALPEFKQLARVVAAGRLGEVEQEKRKGGGLQNPRQGTTQRYMMHSKGGRHCSGHQRDLRRPGQAVRTGGKLQQLLCELLRAGNPGATQRSWCLSMCQPTAELAKWVRLQPLAQEHSSKASDSPPQAPRRWRFGRAAPTAAVKGPQKPRKQPKEDPRGRAGSAPWLQAQLAGSPRGMHLESSE